MSPLRAFPRTQLRPPARHLSGTAALALLATVLFLAAPPATAQEPSAADRDRTHNVRTGDTLWDLAGNYLGDPFRWPEIFRVNVETVRDPHLIYPSSRLRIPMRLGRDADAPPSGGAVAMRPDTGVTRTVFFRTEVRTPSEPDMIVRRRGTADVPFISPGDFYSASFVADDAEVRGVGRLAERETASVIPLDITPQIALYDRVYLALSDPGAVRVGDRMQLIRRERRVRRYGRMFRVTGMARVAAVNGETATAEIVSVYDAIREGDVAVPAAAFPVPAGVSPEPASGLDGRVLAFETINPLQMTESLAFLDLGADAGVTEGDELEVYLPEERRRWGNRPELQVARLRVVRVTDRTATARVQRLEHPALEAGMPVRLVSKMP